MSTRSGVRYAAMAALVLGCGAEMSLAASPGDVVAIEITKHFGVRADFQRGDLIQQADFDAVAKRLAEQGVELADPQAIRGRIPADASFLQRQLSTGKGKAFMRKLARVPGGIRQFHELSRLPDGERIARDLITSPGGESMVQYLSQTTGGARLKGQLPQVSKRRKRAAAPSIYTAEDLATAIIRQLAAASASR